MLDLLDLDGGYPPILNPLAAKYFADPYSYYDRLRRRDPVHRDIVGNLVISRYADIREILLHSSARSRGFVSDHVERLCFEVLDVADEWDGSRVARLLSRSVFMLDPPDHSRVRSLITGSFSRDDIDRITPFIRRTVEELLLRPREAGHINVVADLALPLPTLVMCELLGVPSSDRPLLVEWTAPVSHLIAPVMSRDDCVAAKSALYDSVAYFRELGAWQMERDPAGLLGGILAGARAAEAEDDGLMLAWSLFSAGHETTRNLISSATYHLARLPDIRSYFLAHEDRDLRPITELARYDSPVQVLLRTAGEPLRIRDTAVEAGDRLMLVIGSGNRDPEQFADPDCISFDRRGPSLAFGQGIHGCPGANLGLLEASIGLHALFGGDSQALLSCAESELAWKRSMTLRGLEEVPLEFVRG